MHEDHHGNVREPLSVNRELPTTVPMRGTLASVPRRVATTFAALLATAGLLLAPGASASTKVLKGFWGPTHQPSGQSAFPIYRDLGVNVFQIQLRWSDIAPVKPVNPRSPADPAYLWPSDVSYATQQAKAYHMQVAMMIIFTPRWANGGKSQEWTPKNPQDFANFAYAASKKYPGVHLWMIWGEPSRSPNFQPETPQPGSAANAGKPLSKAQARAPRIYASIVDAAYGQLKSASPKNMVIAGNTFSWGAEGIRPVPWVENMRFGPHNKQPRLDYYGHNPFTNRKPDAKDSNGAFCLDNHHHHSRKAGCADFSDLGWFNKVIDKNLGTKKHKHVQLFLSEFTIPTSNRDSEFPYYVTESGQASWITAGFQVARSVGAKMFGWVHLYDDVDNHYSRFVSGGLLRANGQKKPGYFAFRRG
jgi:hypothetical protein